jgi:hypothetical protein
MGYKILDFIRIILLKGWSAAFSGIVIFLSLVTYFGTGLSTNKKIAALIFIVSNAVLIKVLKQFFGYFQGFRKPIKVKKMVQGDGIYKGINVIVLENDNLNRDGTLVTLYCKSSGAKQPICILELIDTSNDEDIVARAIYPPEKFLELDKYFNEESRKKSLFATPLINVKDSDLHKIIQSYEEL